MLRCVILRYLMIERGSFCLAGLYHLLGGKPSMTRIILGGSLNRPPAWQSDDELAVEVAESRSRPRKSSLTAAEWAARQDGRWAAELRIRIRISTRTEYLRSSERSRVGISPLATESMSNAHSDRTQDLGKLIYVHEVDV